MSRIMPLLLLVQFYINNHAVLVTHFKTQEMWRVTQKYFYEVCNRSGFYVTKEKVMPGLTTISHHISLFLLLHDNVL